MKRITGLLAVCTFVLVGLSSVFAQESEMKPPKVLLIQREFVKPGKGGSTHEKSESAFVQAFAKAKWPTHYLAVDAMSGRPRSLFLVGYDSFEAWEKDVTATQKDATLSSAVDHALAADGELLSDTDQTIATYREDQSLRASGDIAHDRLFEISLYQVKPGHRKQWDELVKLVMGGYEKVPDAHWATYEVNYGQQPSTTYVIFVALKAAREIDEAFGHDKDFVAAMGEDGMKKLGELEREAVETTQTNLFAFNPKMSYASPDWVKADPDFWKPKAPEPMKSKKSEKK